MELGEAERTVKIIIFSFMLLVVILAFVAYAYKYRTPYVPDKLDTLLTVQRFTNTCFAYQDADIGRKYPGVIYPALMTRENMDNCYNPENPVRSYKLKLSYLDKTVTLVTSNWKDGQFKSESRRVLVWENGLHQGTLLIAYRSP